MSFSSINCMNLGILQVSQNCLYKKDATSFPKKLYVLADGLKLPPSALSPLNISMVTGSAGFIPGPHEERDDTDDTVFTSSSELDTLLHCTVHTPPNRALIRELSTSLHTELYTALHSELNTSF